MLVNNNDHGDWIEDSRRVFTEYFPKGLNHTRYQMVRLIDNPMHKFIKVEILNLEANDWIFGCVATEIRGPSRYCSKGVSLSQYASIQATVKQKRTLFMMDLHKLKMKNPQWTHLVVRLLSTDDPVKMTIDVHDPADRTLTINMPKWYVYTTEKLLDDTLLGSSLYNLKIKGEFFEYFRQFL